MITEDYFLRMINQLSYVLASVLKLMKLKRHDEALEEIQASSRQLLGMDLRLLTTLSDAEFIRLLSLGERFDVEKCVVISELLRVIGEIREEQRKEHDAYVVRCRALGLFLELPQWEAVALPREYFDKVDELIVKLVPDGISLALMKKVFAYYEKSGRFDKAEDLLFDIVEEERSFSDSGVAFYERLLQKSDEELAQGGLSREEVDAGKRDLLKRTS